MLFPTSRFTSEIYRFYRILQSRQDDFISVDFALWRLTTDGAYRPHLLLKTRTYLGISSTAEEWRLNPLKFST